MNPFARVVAEESRGDRYSGRPIQIQLKQSFDLALVIEANIVC